MQSWILTLQPPRTPEELSETSIWLMPPHLSNISWARTLASSYACLGWWSAPPSTTYGSTCIIRCAKTAPQTFARTISQARERHVELPDDSHIEGEKALIKRLAGKILMAAQVDTAPSGAIDPGDGYAWLGRVTAYATDGIEMPRIPPDMRRYNSFGGITLVSEDERRIICDLMRAHPR